MQARWESATLVPDGRIQGRWTQKWPSKISCGLGSQRPRKRPNSKFHNCGLILTIIGKNWPKNLWKKFFTALFLMISGVAGLRPNFFLQRPNFLAELAQESWRDLAAVESSASLSIQLDRALAGLIDIETKWRISVVSECCWEAVLASDRALIVYRLLVRLSL